jgi:Tfp pilus assembly protein PilF
VGIRENLLAMLEKGNDSATIRFALGNEYLKDNDPANAAAHLARAVAQDPAYSAAWKAFGKALSASGRPEDAIAAYREGIRIAGQRGDVQAVKEMQVFLKRLVRARDK